MLDLREPRVSIEPRTCAISILVVKKHILGDVDEEGHTGGYEANDGNQDPALGAIEPGVEPSTDVLPCAQCLDSVGVFDGVVDPIWRRNVSGRILGR